MKKTSTLFLVLSSIFLSQNSYALETLSYSGRLVQANGAPVLGPVTIKAELAYTNSLTNVLCSEEITNVNLTKGVFHLKLNLDCTDSGLSLTQVLSQVPNGESVAIQITDLTHSKSYNFQAMHAIPFANVASQLVQMGATDNQVIKWNNTTKKWEPGAPGGGGTVTTISVTPPLAVTNPTTTPALSISQASSSTNGYLSSADWTTFNNKEGTISGGTTAQYYRGDKSWQTLNTDAVPEGARLYFENARVLGVPLTGFTSSNLGILSSDTVIEAFGKTQGQINSIQSSATHFLLKDSADTLSSTTTLSGSINSTLTGDITVNTTPLGLTSAVNKSYVDTGDNLKVSKVGDTVTGILNLNNDLRIKGSGASTNYVTIRGHATTANYNFILPSSAGTTGQFLQTDGSGNLSWNSQSTTAIPSGSAGGDLSGTYPNPTVPGLATKLSTSLTNGSIYVGNAGVATAVSVSGDATLSNTGVLTLSNTAVTPGTFKSVTVDSKGRITAGTNPTTLAGYGITDAIVRTLSFSTPLLNTGTTVNPHMTISQASTMNNGYVSSTDFNTFNNKQAAITAATDLTVGSILTNKQNALTVNPFNTAAGNTGELRFRELTANGSNYIALKSPDVIASDVVLTLPPAYGTAGQVLTTNATGVLSWTTAATSSTSLVGDIGGTIGANTIGSGKVTLAHLSATGTKDVTTYLRGDNTFSNFVTDVRATSLTGLSTVTNAVITAGDSVLSALGKVQKQISDLAISTVGGDLTGTLPNPTVAKIQGRAVTSSAPLAGQVLKYNTGTPAWEPSYVLVGDLKSSALGNLFPASGCTANQTLYYSVIGDAFSCVDIGSLDASKITTGTIAAARLPASATYWSAATGGINYAAGNVGIGISNPTTKLEVDGVIKATGFQGAMTSTTVSSGNGSSAAPSYSFNNSSATGFYSVSPGSISVSSGGTPVFSFTGTGLNSETAGGAKVRSIASSAAEPTYSFAGDEDTGWYSPLADTLAASTAGVERIRIDSNGNIGMGTILPKTKLHLKDNAVGSFLPLLTLNNSAPSNGSSVGLLFNVAETHGQYSKAGIAFERVTSSGRGSIHFLQNNQDNNSSVTGVENSVMSIAANGRVGIGTTMMNSTFNLVGGSYISDISTVSPGLPTPDVGQALVSNSAGSNYVLHTANNSVNTGPGITFYRSRGTTTVPTQTISGDQIMGFFGRGHTGTGYLGNTAAFKSIATEDYNATSGGSALTFETTPNGSTARSERLRINENGNIGVGTKTPESTLHIFSRGGTAPIPLGSESSIILESTPTTEGSQGYVGSIWFGSREVSDTQGTTKAAGIVGYMANDVSETSAPSHLLFYTTASGSITAEERMKITPAGNVGIATVNPSERLEVNGNVKAASYLYTSDLRLKSNVVTIEDSLSKILSLRGVEFDWNNSGNHEIGLIAQEVEAVEPYLVTTSVIDGMKAVKYGNIVALLIEAMKAEHLEVQENKKMIKIMNNDFEKMDNRVQVLEREIASLRDENTQLKSDIESIKKHLKLK